MNYEKFTTEHQRADKKMKKLKKKVELLFCWLTLIQALMNYFLFFVCDNKND